MAIKALLRHAFEHALNRFLSLDSQREQYLTPLNGKIIAVHLLPFKETLYLCPTTDSIQILDQSPQDPDPTLTGSVFAFGLMGLSQQPMRSIFSGDIVIEGDLHVGRKFQSLFSQLDLNLEGLLARYIGDQTAQSLSQFFKKGQHWSQDSLDTLKLNLSEFLQEETRDLPSAPEVEIFYSQVDDLRSDFDRLNSRIERLQKIDPQGNSWFDPNYSYA